MTSIDVYFDFISPFAYLAAPRIRRLAAAHGREIRWRPFRLGVTVVKVMGLRPVMQTPLKGEYALADIRRLATILGERFEFDGVLPDPLPAARLVYAAPAERVDALVDALLRTQWAEGRDIGALRVLQDIGASLGLTPDTVRSALEGACGSTELREATQEAIARGVFGSPTCAVGDALFWGLDRLWLLDLYLQNGEQYGPIEPDRSRALALS